MSKPPLTVEEEKTAIDKLAKLGIEDAHQPPPTPPTRTPIRLTKEKFTVLLENKGRTISLLNKAKEVLERKNSPTFTLDIKQTAHDLTNWLITHRLVATKEQAEKITTTTFVSLRKAYALTEENYHAKLQAHNIAMNDWLSKNQKKTSTTEQEDELTQAQLAYQFVQQGLANERFISTGEPERSTIYRYHEGVYIPNGKQFVYSHVEQELGERATKYLKGEVIQRIYSQSVEHEFPEAPSNLLCLKNGVLNVLTKQLKPHTPTDAFLQKIEIEYDPKTKCPQFEKFLIEVLPEERDRTTIKKWFGYHLLRDYRYAAFLIFFGTGSNGKSTLLQVLTTFVGLENVSAITPHSMNDKFATFGLKGKIANIVADISSKGLDKTATAKIKSITGGDPMDAEQKFGSKETLLPYAKLSFSANALPEIPEDNEAVWRRIILIKFNQHFGVNNRDPTKIDQLTTPQELSGILNWALEGLKELLATNGFDTAVVETREFYIRQTDPIRCFLLDRTVRSPNAQLLKSELYESYCSYCESEDRESLSEKEFYKQLYAKTNYARATRVDFEGKQQRCVKGFIVLESIKAIIFTTITREEEEVCIRNNITIVRVKGYTSIPIEYKGKKMIAFIDSPSIDSEQNLPRGELLKTLETHHQCRYPKSQTAGGGVCGRTPCTFQLGQLPICSECGEAHRILTGGTTL